MSPVDDIGWGFIVAIYVAMFLGIAVGVLSHKDDL